MLPAPQIDCFHCPALTMSRPQFTHREKKEREGKKREREREKKKGSIKVCSSLLLIFERQIKCLWTNLLHMAKNNFLK